MAITLRLVLHLKFDKSPSAGSLTTETSLVGKTLHGAVCRIICVPVAQSPQKNAFDLLQDQEVGNHSAQVSAPTFHAQHRHPVPGHNPKGYNRVHLNGGGVCNWLQCGFTMIPGAVPATTRRSRVGQLRSTRCSSVSPSLD